MLVQEAVVGGGHPTHVSLAAVGGHPTHVSQPTLGRLGADLGPTWGRPWAGFGPTLGRLGADFGPTLGRLWVDLGPTLGRLGVDFWTTFGEPIQKPWQHPTETPDRYRSLGNAAKASVSECTVRTLSENPSKQVCLGTHNF